MGFTRALPVDHGPPLLCPLIEGCPIHYVAYKGRHLMGFIVGFDPNTGTNMADIVIFTNMSNVNGVKNFGMQFHADVEYSEEAKPGTYHFSGRA